MTQEAVPHDPQAAVEYMLKTAPRLQKPRPSGSSSKNIGRQKRRC